ncbi:hypothetical protein AAZX31_12G002900 [Glycine max]
MANPSLTSLETCWAFLLLTFCRSLHYWNQNTLWCQLCICFCSAGILDESGRHYGDHQYSLSQQVLNFENTLNQYRTMMDASALNQFLASSIAVVVTGSNDYINNYLLPGLYGSSYNYTAQQFGNLLVNKFWHYIA